MSFSDMIKKSVLEGFNYTDISTSRIAVVLAETFVLALFIFFVYKYLTRSTFFNKNFGVSMSIIAVVTAGIVLAMQSNLAISLGMVGALSIVRFRTAIKEPIDLLFLFWSIGSGIMCGAGLFELALIVALVVTIGILVLQLIPVTKSSELLIVKLSDKAAEEKVMELVKKFSPKHMVDSKSIVKGNVSLVIEIKTAEGAKLVNDVSEVEGVAMATLMQHEGEVKN